MKQHRSKWAGNAEVEIDYIKKKVSFKHPAKRNENLSYFTHSFYTTLGYIFGIVMWGIIIKWTDFVKYAESTIISLLITLFLVLYAYGGRILFGYISILIHKISPTARKAFPKTNSITTFLMSRKKTIDLSQKYSKNHYIDKNKLILFNYDIAYFRFKYEGKNKLLKVNTKSVEKKKKKGEHYNFIAIFTFKDIIKRGILNYC